ncbi:hypothetical protein SETIT_3G220900v2 [Setaria italica]|uniref:Uncharacterized protein n=1 Tax=Setaria italica TaxID=4555 RepID=K3ZB27_SETIT|nr:hypothetical protein SETIT_3G220900v2 [Setaria italica]
MDHDNISRSGPTAAQRVYPVNGSGSDCHLAGALLLDRTKRCQGIYAGIYAAGRGDMAMAVDSLRSFLRGPGMQDHSATAGTAAGQARGGQCRWIGLFAAAAS